MTAEFDKRILLQQGRNIMYLDNSSKFGPREINPYDTVDFLAKKFGEETALQTCHVIDGILTKMKQEGHTISRRRARKNAAFQNALNSSWSEAMNDFPNDANGLNDAFDFWKNAIDPQKAKILSRSPNVVYFDQVSRYGQLEKAASTPRASIYRSALVEKFGEESGSTVSDTIDATIKRLRGEGQVVLDNKIIDEPSFKRELQRDGDNLANTSEIETAEAFDYWFNKRVEIERDSLTRTKKVKEFLSSTKGKLTYALAVSLMAKGLDIQNKFGTPEEKVQPETSTDAKKITRILQIPQRTKERLIKEAIMTAEAMMKAPVWMQMQNEIKNHVKVQKKDGEILSQEQVQDLITQFSKYYQIPSENNPFIQNPNFAKKLLHAGLSSFISKLIADGIGITAYAGALKVAEAAVERVGSVPTLTIATIIAGLSIWARARSDVKALQKNGYSSSFAEAALYSTFQVTHNDDASEHKEKDAKRATVLTLVPKTVGFMTLPWYLPFIYAKPPISTAAWIGSYPADQIVYTVSNNVPNIMRSVSNLKEGKNERNIGSQVPLETGKEVIL